jgi:plasmid stabilization system protein ParE
VKARPELHPLVRFDLLESFVWYEAEQPDLGGRFVRQAGERIGRLPQEAFFYRVRFSDIRRANLRRFPHGIFFFIQADTVIVLGVLHAARDSEAELLSRRELYG